MVNFPKYITDVLQFHAPGVAQQLFGIVIDYFYPPRTPATRTQRIRIACPQRLTKWVKDDWDGHAVNPGLGIVGNSDPAGLRISRSIKIASKDQPRVHLEVVAPMRATAKLVNNSNAATSTQIANWMGGAEEFGFVGHSDYLVAIIPISTLNFDALCPNLTKAVFTGSVTTGAFRTIVAALQNLKELEIGLVVVDDLGTTPTTVLNHRRLEHLKLRSNIGVAIMLKGVKLSRLNQFHLWLAPLAASGCTAHDFAGSKWGTQCELTVNFTSSDVKFTEDMKRYGITVSTCNHAGWISPGIEETCQVAGIGSYTMPDKVIDNLSQ